MTGTPETPAQCHQGCELGSGSTEGMGACLPQPAVSHHGSEPYLGTGDTGPAHWELLTQTPRCKGPDPSGAERRTKGWSGSCSFT